MLTPRLHRTLAVFVLTGALALTACSTGGTHWTKAGSSPSTTSSSPAPKITSPASGATDVPAGMDVAYTVPAGAKADVTLTAADGSTVAGSTGYDASTWVPAKALAYGSQYTAKVTSTGTDGKATTSTVSFTTMAKPAHLITVQSYLGDHMTYGNAVPIVLSLSHSVPDDSRATIQKRLSVTTTPTQVGAWSWINDHEIHWRPKAQWQAGSTFDVAVNTGGVPMGNGYYGKNDLTVSASITKNLMSIVVDDKTHMLTVTVNGKVVKKMPASNGKPSTPSSSGKLVIMTRKPSEIFDSSLGTGGTPVNSPGGYKELVLFTMRLTWDGQFIHAAPWSVKSQGHTDVSHGCTNVSTANAKWIYENSLVGTPVTVEGTPRPVANGDGWTDWNVSWASYIKGSALPVTE